jgi:hypothetical protein
VQRPETRNAFARHAMKKFYDAFSVPIRARSRARFIALHKISLRRGEIFITVKSGSRSVSRTKSEK